MNKSKLEEKRLEVKRLYRQWHVGRKQDDRNKDLSRFID
jgi:hypothetical protein